MGDKKVVYTEQMPEGIDKIVTKTHIIIRVKNIAETNLPLCVHRQPINEVTKYACSKLKLKHCI